MKKPKLTTSGKIFFGTIILILLFIVFSTFYSKNNVLPEQSTTTTTTSATITATPTAGRILIGFKDSVHTVPRIGIVTMLNLNATKFYLRENNKTNWITIFDGSKFFDIITLSNQTAIIADTKIPIENYTQEKIVLGIGSIKVYYPLYNLYGRLNYSLYPATNETIVTYSFSPMQSATTILIFDLNVENSISHTADGYFLSPQFTVSSLVIQNDQQPADSVFIS